MNIFTFNEIRLRGNQMGNSGKLLFTLASIFLILQWKGVIGNPSYTVDRSKIYKNDAVMGKLQENDRLLFTLAAVQYGREKEIVTEDVVFPENGEEKEEIIHYIKILDQKYDGTGGLAYVKKGGIGYNFTTISINSQPGRDYSFLIYIFGSIEH